MNRMDVMCKPLLSLVILLWLRAPLVAQESGSLSGDWMRVKAEFRDGRQLPGNHHARVIQRYYFVKDKVYLIVGGQTNPSSFSVAGGTLQIGPAQTFEIEHYADEELVLLERGEGVRQILIPRDSFTISGIVKYTYVVQDPDTIYTVRTGIEPVYADGHREFMRTIQEGFTAVKAAAFTFTYVVLKDGSIGEVEVTKSTNEKLNKILVKQVKRTSRKWIPATLNGKPINVQMSGNISLGR
jgi:hypothetical protein